MGMSSSQARLLTLTARMHDIELRAQRIQAEKLRLANDADKVYNTYLDALDATKVQFKSVATDGTTVWHDATLASLENGLIPTYTGLTSPETYFLKDSKTGATYISKDYAASIGITSDSEIFTGPLNDWLEMKHAPKKPEVYISSYTDGFDENNILSIETYPCQEFDPYVGPTYTYDDIATNCTEGYPDCLVAGKTYVVSDETDLIHLATLSQTQSTQNVTIVLGGDITMSSGAAFTSIKNFQGTFNGNGHKISNLNDCLFDSTNGAIISNLELSNCNVTKNANNAGTLAAIATNTTISNVKATGTVNGTGNAHGGLVGYSTQSTITKCSFDGTVNGTTSTGGFVGSAINSTINNCSVSGTVNSTKTGGGFVGHASDGTISYAKSNCTINIDATGSGHPDSGGFCGISGKTTFDHCEARGTLNDNTTGQPTVCSGFIGCTGGGTAGSTISVTISNSDSYVNVNTKDVVACGFGSAHTYTNLYLTNCNYHGTVSTTPYTPDGAGPGFSFVYGADNGAGYSNMVYVTNCTSTTSTTTDGTALLLQNTNVVGTVSIGYVNTNTISVTAPTLGATSISGDALEMSLLGSDVAAIPNVDTTTMRGGLFSNLMALLVKYGTYDPRTATTGQTAQMEGYVEDYLSNFNDDEAGNSELYHLNQYIVTYLNMEDKSTDFSKAMVRDLLGRTIAYTSEYRQGSVVPNILRSTTDSTWEPTDNPEHIGKIVVPSKDTIKANIIAGFKKSGDNISEAQIDDFLALYGTGTLDLAYLATVNDIVNNYAVNGGTMDVLKNAITSTPAPTKITALPTSYMTDISQYTITQQTDDHSGDVKINYAPSQDPVYSTRMVFDYDKPTTKQLVDAYYAQLNGYIIIGDDNDPGMDHSTEWLINMVRSGTAYIVKPTYNDKDEYEEVSIITENSLREVENEKNVKKAEAQYEADMRRIDRKDAKCDGELAACENERNAIKSEIDTLKNVIKDNVNLNFKLFS